MINVPEAAIVHVFMVLDGAPEQGESVIAERLRTKRLGSRHTQPAPRPPQDPVQSSIRSTLVTFGNAARADLARPATPRL